MYNHTIGFFVPNSHRNKIMQSENNLIHCWALNSSHFKLAVFVSANVGKLSVYIKAYSTKMKPSFVDAYSR